MAIRKPETATRPTAREEIRPAAELYAQTPPKRTADGRLVVLNRRGEPVSRSSAASGVDQFFIPEGMIPEGWSWEWKRVLVANQPDPAYEAECAQVGWEPVMAESFPGVFMPHGAKGPIMRRGLMLMERDMRLTEEARNEEKRRADERVGTAVRKHQLNTMGAHGVSVDDRAVRANTYVRKSMEVVDAPPPQYDRVAGRSVD